MSGRSAELQTPRNCISQRAIKAFLKSSRKFSDDSLPTHLPRSRSCGELVTTVLFPAWSERDEILDYCDQVADNISSQEASSSSTNSEVTMSSIDPRIDAYGARDAGKVPEGVGEQIKTWVANEHVVEAIIRDNSASILADKCGSFATRPESFLSAYRDSFRPK